jgi:hypothetical protein
MSYQRFHAAIEDASLIAVAEHWAAARADRPMPGWKDIDPAAIRQCLPIVWSWRYDPALGTFIGRLAGEEIVAVLGVSVRSKRLDECFPAGARELVLARYKAVIDGPALMHSHGKVFRLSGGHGYGERIVLPLAADGTQGDGVLGATIYQLGIKPTTRGEVAIDHHNEIVDFFPLG